MRERGTQGESRLDDRELRASVLTAPELESLKVDLIPDLLVEPRELLAAALEAGGVDAPRAGAWEIEPVHESLPGSFFLVPPESGSLSVADGWNLAYALQRQPGALDAEPLFDTILDVADQPSSEDGRDEEEANEDEPAPAPPGEGLVAGHEECAPIAVSESDHDWSPELIRATAAWDIASGAGGAQRGKGIRIGHPDSGFLDHSELFDAANEQSNRVLAHLGHDFVDRDPDPKHPDGGHGLATASVAISAVVDLEEGFVHGVAPEAEIVPFRVAKKRPVVPVPVLLSGGMRRLAQAIYRATDPPASCDVISISLGWIKSKAVREAVRYAIERDVIIVAGAGNWVRFVVWPAAYPNVIAMAGCTAGRRKWKGSSRGKKVDATAPASRVWKARTGGGVEPSSGTSYAAASTAGIAALWLAHWGRANLLAKYHGEFKLATVFRKVLRDTCDPPPPGHDGKFGAGIVNACRVLKAPLPEPEDLSAANADVLEALALSPAPPVALGGLEMVAEALGRSETALRAPLAAMTGIAPDQLPRALRGVGDELAFQILTTPALRDALVEPGTAEIEAGVVSLGAAAQAVTLAPERLSARLRSRMGL